MRRKHPILPANGPVVQADCCHEVVKSLDCSLMNHPFHADPWNYLFYLKRGQTDEGAQQSVILEITLKRCRAC